MQEQLLKLLLAVSEGQRATRRGRCALQIGEPLPDFDEVAFRRDIRSCVVDVPATRASSEMQVGRVDAGDRRGPPASTASGCRPSSRCSARRC